LWAEEITRLRSDLAAALAECKRLNKSRNRWGKKYNVCLGKLRLAVMSDSDYVKEIDYQNTRLRNERAAVTEERDKLREALEPFAKAADCCEDKSQTDYGSVRIDHLRAARAAIAKARGETGENVG
jgi:hypothetical protein